MPVAPDRLAALTDETLLDAYTRSVEGFWRDPDHAAYRAELLRRLDGQRHDAPASPCDAPGRDGPPQAGKEP